MNGLFLLEWFYIKTPKPYWDSASVLVLLALKNQFINHSYKKLWSVIQCRDFSSSLLTGASVWQHCSKSELAQFRVYVYVRAGQDDEFVKYTSYRCNSLRVDKDKYSHWATCESVGNPIGKLGLHRHWEGVFPVLTLDKFWVGKHMYWSNPWHIATVKKYCSANDSLEKSKLLEQNQLSDLSEIGA